MPKVFFNELSASGTANSDNIAEIISGLVECLKELRKRNVLQVTTDKRFDEIRLTWDYSLNDVKPQSFKHCDNDAKALIIDYFSTASPLSDYMEDRDVLYGECNGHQAVGLTVASDHVLNEITMSVPQTGWDDATYALIITRLNKDGDEIQVGGNARNISSLNHFADHADVLPLPPEPVPANGKVLGSRLSALFPNLTFSKQASDFIKRCNSGETVEQIYFRLKDLQRVALSIGTLSFAPEMFSFLASPESSTRDRLPELDILFPDGITRHCGWHLRYTPGAGRIHFSNMHCQANRICVGYVGEKIGT